MRPSRSPSGSRPTHTTSPRGQQRVEIGGLIVGHARGKDLTLQIGGDQRGALQNFDGIEQRVEAAARRGDALPAREQAREGVLFGRHHFAAQARQRLAADLLQHVRVAPFAMHAAGPELAFQQLALGVEAPQHGFDFGGREAIARGDIGGGERSVRARIAAQEFQQRIGRWARERLPPDPAAAACPRHRDSARRIRRE